MEQEAGPAEHLLPGDPGGPGEIATEKFGQRLVIRHLRLPCSAASAGILPPPTPRGASPMSEPVFVLVRPQMGENIGAAARGMWNFGLKRMRIVAPRDGWPNPKAIADAHFVFATTARDRDLTKDVYTPEAAMAHARDRIARGERVAVLFGPERAGLENDDIARSNAIVSVPVNPDFPSLNLAQCVLLTGYEWRRATAPAEPRQMEWAGTEPATAVEVDHLARHYEDRLGEAGFFFPETKAQAMKLTLRNLWSRMPLTRSDVQVLHGIMRQMVRWKERGHLDDPGSGA